MGNVDRYVGNVHNLVDNSNGKPMKKESFSTWKVRFVHKIVDKERILVFPAGFLCISPQLGL